MEIRPVTTDRSALLGYERLFRRCFPNAFRLSIRYLNWLYALNPVGQVIGSDAWFGETLAAHYVGVPGDALVDGRKVKVLLSLNTATHPDFQGKGLFTRLAEATYERATALGMSAVYGVANANSTPGFTRKLGFTLVRPLEAKVGFGRIGDAAVDAAGFRREWSKPALAWRIANPERPYTLVRAGGATVGAEARTGWIGLRAWDEVLLPAGVDAPRVSPSVAMRLHLGLRPRNVGYRKGMWVEIPQRFRPSPLNLIFRPLASGIAAPLADFIRLGQLDFDAF